MAREVSNTKVYHVILRGNAKQDIFLDKQDYLKFLKELDRTKEKYQYDLYAYCLMTNHVHMLLYDKEEMLGKIIQSITISYSTYFNNKYERVGHLFQNRFLSKKVETQEYLLNVCRYIHENPVKAGLATIDDYMWSSYQEYVTEKKRIENRQILQLFSDNRQRR